MIVVLNGTRLTLSSGALLVRRQPWLQVVGPYVAHQGLPRRHGFLDAVDVLRVRHPVRIYSGGL
jgi:hypothetical protein